MLLKSVVCVPYLVMSAQNAICHVPFYYNKHLICSGCYIIGINMNTNNNIRATLSKVVELYYAILKLIMSYVIHNFIRPKA